MWATGSGGDGDVEPDGYETLGRCAKDRVMLVGDYDKSGLYDRSESYTDTSDRLRREYNGEAGEDGVLETMGLS